MNRRIYAALGELANAEADPDAHDSAGPRFGPSSPEDGDDDRDDSRGPAPRPSDTTALVQTTQPAQTVEEILKERGKTHGDFSDNARVMQSMKRIVHSELGWDRLTDVQREALHMILHKVGRIISGNPNIKDHWDDIAGYAKLASERTIQ